MSDYGLRIRDASGNVIFDSIDGVARVFSTQSVAKNSSGSYTNASLQTAKPFWVFYPSSSVPPDIGSWSYPVISSSGSKISWSAGTVGCQLVIGAYAIASSPAATISGDYGLIVKNAQGQVLIDNTHSNLFFASKQSISLNEGSSTTITVTASMPVIAYRGTGMIAIGAMTSTGTNTWSVKIYGSGQVQTVGTIYIFDAAGNGHKLDSANYGLRLRDASGNVIFDSRMKVANIVGDGNIASDAQTTSTLSKNNLAVIVCSGFYYFNNLED